MLLFNYLTSNTYAFSSFHVHIIKSLPLPREETIHGALVKVNSFRFQQRLDFYYLNNIIIFNKRLNFYYISLVYYISLCFT